MSVLCEAYLPTNRSASQVRGWKAFGRILPAENPLGLVGLALSCPAADPDLTFNGGMADTRELTRTAWPAASVMPQSTDVHMILGKRNRVDPCDGACSLTDPARGRNTTSLQTTCGRSLSESPQLSQVRWTTQNGQKRLWTNTWLMTSNRWPDREHRPRTERHLHQRKSDPCSARLLIMLGLRARL